VKYVYNRFCFSVWNGSLAKLAYYIFFIALFIAYSLEYHRFVCIWHNTIRYDTTV